MKKIGVLTGCLLLATTVYAQRNSVQAARLMLASPQFFPPAIQRRIPPGFSAQLQRKMQEALRKKRELAAMQPLPAQELVQQDVLLKQNIHLHKKLLLPELSLPDMHDDLLAEIQLLLNTYPRLSSHPVFLGYYLPATVPSSFSVKNNRLVLVGLKHLIQKLHWLEDRPQRGKAEMESQSGAEALFLLAEKLSHEKMVMLGEMHYIPGIQNAVEELVLEIQRLQPGRRIVLFTEFVDLPEHMAPGHATTETYYRRVAQEPLEKLGDEDLYLRVGYAKSLFATLVRNGVDVYPLEDRTLCHMIEREESPLAAEKNSPRAIMLRNQTWARVMERKMADIRRTDPDALFIVYAGMGHTSWVVPYSIPKFFASEQPVVVELSPLAPARMNTLSVVWGDNDPFFTVRKETTLHYWTGSDARLLAQKTGFDYAFVLAGRKLRWKTDGL